MMARMLPSVLDILSRVSTVSKFSSGGANNRGCPPNITRSNVEPDREGERIKIAGGFFGAGAAGGSREGTGPVEKGASIN